MNTATGVLMLKKHTLPILAVLLALITVGVYWQTVGYSFTNYDDDSYVTENPPVANGLSPASLKWAFTTGYQCTWQPLVWISYMLDIELFGANAGGFHLTNLLLHLANTVLLLLVLVRMTGSIWKSGFVAALFAIHPLHVESVAWIAERKDVLSGLFWILAMLAYVEYARRPHWKRYALVMLAFVAGLMSKPMVVTLPIALLLLDYWPLRRVEAILTEEPRVIRVWRRLAIEKLPLLCLAVVSSVLTYFVQNIGGAVSSFESIPVGVRIANAFFSYTKYIAQMVWPVNLAVIYPHPGNSIPRWEVVTSAAALVIITWLWWRLAPKWKYVLVGWLWFVITMLPVIGIISFGSHGMADRFTYLPLIGLFIILAWGIPDLLRPWLARKSRLCGIALSAVSVLVVAVMSWTAHTQASYWEDSSVLFEHAMQVVPNNYVAHNQLGFICDSAGAIGTAEEHYLAALRIKPNYYDAQMNLSVLYVQTGRARQAIPGILELVQAHSGDPKPRLNLGIAYQKIGRTDLAIPEFVAAIRIKPDYVAAHGNLANALLSIGRVNEAIAHYKQILKIDPNDKGARQNLAIAMERKEHPEAATGGTETVQQTAEAHNSAGMQLAGEGRFDEAIREYREALRLNPRLANAYINLGVAFAHQGVLDEAIKQYKTALRLDPKSAEACSNIGAALGMQGDVNGAIKWFRHATKIDPSLKDAHQNLATALYHAKDYAEAWKAVKAGEECGASFPQQFIDDLSAAMPEP